MLRAGLCVCFASLIGCGGDNRDSIISNNSIQLSEAATAVDSIKSKVAEYVKKKEAGNKDEEGAKKDLEEAISDAKKLKEIAQKMQSLSTQANSRTPQTAEEKKALLEKHLGRINETQDQLKTAHRAMKAEIAEANKKYEEQLRPLILALSDAEGEFAAISRRK